MNIIALIIGLAIFISPFLALWNVYKTNQFFKNYRSKINDMSIEERNLVFVKIQSEIEQRRTNHILHLLLSIFTGSFWFFLVWLPVGIKNRYSRKKWESLQRSI